MRTRPLVTAFAVVLPMLLTACDGDSVAVDGSAGDGGTAPPPIVQATAEVGDADEDADGQDLDQAPTGAARGDEDAGEGSDVDAPAGDEDPGDSGARPTPTPTTPTTPTPTPTPVTLDVGPLDWIVTTSGFTPYADDNHAAWAVEVPEADDVRIPSSTSTTQPAFWAAPEGEDQPLLVVLHSWSTDYAQQLSIPLARWAVDNGWGMVAPNFRGVNNRPEATGSDLAVGDVIAAVEWALAEGGGDPDLVFGIGFSGGGMMALDLVGRHPEVFAGLVSWVPIYDLVEWDAHNRGQSPRPHYVWHLEASCGGQPREGSQAARSCAARSPATHLDAEDAEEVGVFLGAGLHDEIVPVSHAVRSFNALARPEDRFPPAHVAAFAEGRLPEDLDEPASAEHHFGDDADVLVARRSGRVTLVIFDGTHEMRYGPGIRWIGEGGWAPQDRG